MAASRIPVAVLGATGSVGQRFLTLLAGHPWFEVVALVASERSSGLPYRQAVSWVQETPVPPEVAGLEVLPLGASLPCRLLFSALDAGVAGEAEAVAAGRGHFVVSNARNHRMDPEVPLVVPEVNPDHLELAAAQPYGGGALVTNPNCSTIGLVLALAPLVAAFGVEEVLAVTLQALSGAGLPGVPAMAATDNVIPWIGGEEEKLEAETLKILGERRGGGIAPASFPVSAHCNRVPVVDGHTLCVSLRLSRPAAPGEVAAALATFTGEPQRLGLPTAPARPVEVTELPDRPQPRLDRGRGGGMTVTVGRIRPCPLLGIKLVALVHNTVRGAAGGALLVAELAVARGLVPGVAPPKEELP
jgi:aspartate-semialdehyde dehydrogenase